jgi:mannose-1-phosphate guanylyltransferase
LKSEWDQTRKVFEAVDKESIDCALWEKLPSDGIKVVACDYDWNYVSTWADIKSALTDSEDQNYIQGKVITDQIQNSLIVNFTNRLVVVTELDDVAVINTEDAILVTKKSHAGKVKDLVKKLEDSGLQKYL